MKQIYMYMYIIYNYEVVKSEDSARTTKCAKRKENVEESDVKTRIAVYNEKSLKFCFSDKIPIARRLINEKIPVIYYFKRTFKIILASI